MRASIFAFLSLIFLLFALGAVVAEYVKVGFVKTLLGVYLAVLKRVFRRLFQGSKLTLYLLHALCKHKKVIAGGVHLSFSVRLSVLEYDYARRFLENRASVLRLGVHNLVDSALTDNRIAFLCRARAVQKSRKDFHARGLAVKLILAFAVAVKPSCHFHFVAVYVKDAVGVVEGERNLAKGHLPSFIGAAENDVKHLRAAHHFSRLLAENPADSVRNVAFAAAVGADNTRYSLTERYGGFIRKGFKTDKLYTFECNHRKFPVLSKKRGFAAVNSL